MKTATSLALLAIGGILAFAVTAEPSFFSFRVAGWVLIVIGIAGAVLPRRGYGWLRRRLVLTGTGRRVVIDRGQRQRQRPRVRQRQRPRVLRNGVITRQRDTLVPREVIDVLPIAPADATKAVERDTIEQYVEE